LQGRPESDGPVRRNKKNDKGEDHRNHGDARGRIPWKDEEQKKRNVALYSATPAKAAAPCDLPNLSGDWMCSATSGDWDEFLYLLEVDEFTRKLAKARKWGVRHSEQRVVLSSDKQKISIATHQQKLQYTTNPTSADSAADNAPAAAAKKAAADNLADVVMLINGEPQQIVYEGHTGTGTLNWEGKVLVTRMELPKLGPVRVGDRRKPALRVSCVPDCAMFCAPLRMCAPHRSAVRHQAVIGYRHDDHDGRSSRVVHPRIADIHAQNGAHLLARARTHGRIGRIVAERQATRRTAFEPRAVR
jgi:hypothetical protein